MSSTHSMCTRSNPSNDPPNDVDDQGNLHDLIDYSCTEEFDRDELNKELLRLSKGNIDSEKAKKRRQVKKIIIEEPNDTLSPKKSKNKIKKSGSKNDLGGILMTYILAKANENIKKKPKKKRTVIKIGSNESIQSLVESSDDEIIENDIDLEELTDKTTTSEELNDDLDDLDDEFDEDLEEETEEESEEESEEGSEYDEYDDEYNEIVEKYMSDNTEDGNLDYFHGLKEEEKLNYIEEIKNVYSMNSNHIPLKFKVLNSDMDIYTKSIAINNLDKLSEMDISTGEYNKMDQWINGLIKLPFGKVTNLPVKNDDDFEKKRDYIQTTLENMNKAIYGHMEAKTHILQVIGKWMRNPNSLGNVLAIQGPMGNGKTTLIKNGIAKSLNRPFEFVALGGASDSAFFEGHSYTYEGSRWGRIVDILHKCGSMNPIICFDELDKVSETAKGDEIVNMLIHMTDSSQNSKFQDNYFPGIDIDLSKVLFIFSFNDESKINRILKDRMYVIRTKGYDTKDKLKIAHNYLLPEIYELFNYTKDDIVFTDGVLTEIISKYTAGEEGVRNLKRCLENIVSTLNIYHLTKSDDKEDIIDMKIKDFKLPITLKQEHITSLLKIDNSGKAPEHMYM
jgi:ATP-dependent Lon protease